MGIIRDVENYPKWTSGISDIEIIEQDDAGKPLKTIFSLEGGPISDRIELAYEWQPNSVNWHLVKGSSITKLDGSYTVTEQESGCDVTYELSAEINIPLPSFIKSAGEKTIVNSALQGLKDFAK